MNFLAHSHRIYVNIYNQINKMNYLIISQSPATTYAAALKAENMKHIKSACLF